MYKITGGPAPWYAPQVRVHDSGAILLLTEDRSEVLRIIAPGHWYEAELTEEAPPKVFTEFHVGLTWKYTEELLKLPPINAIKELRALNSTGLGETKNFLEHLAQAGIYKNPATASVSDLWKSTHPKMKSYQPHWTDNDDGNVF